METMELLRMRHSVREYTSEPIEGEQRAALLAAIEDAASESGLSFHLVENQPEAFDVVAKFGLIHGCSSYIACPITDSSQEEALGYWGQHIVLAAWAAGLNTCWVGMFSRKKAKANLKDGERLRCVIAVGHGKTDGHDRTSKSADQVANCLAGEWPQWFANAVEAALQAPTAMNAQNFEITLLEDGRAVRAEAKNRGFRMIDLGIVKHDFELVANESGVDWLWA